MNTIIEKLKAIIRLQIKRENLNFAALGGGGQTWNIETLEWVLKRLSDLEKEEKSRRVRTLEEEFDGYNPVVVTLDKYVLEGIGVGRHGKVIIKIQRKED